VAEAAEEDLDALSFEELVDRLEALTAQLADGGQRLHAAATARLDAVARRIDAL